ncbi:GNAT family N-acetyltransferase [Microbulbifer sp. ALW1]|uniref:GNAT family N-acetyltransferase n=1 Tax=Microbulbifer sp. (strain ALW1) TaxID=1516059 RepID=UPI001356B616|nr:GNAT family N-acetyltransferase [Microbulbifer sp. ALW1]
MLITSSNQSMDIVDLAQVPQAIETLARWHYDEWQQLYPEESLADFIADLRASTAAIPVPSTFVARENDVLIGSISLLERDMEIDEPWTPWLANLFVHPDYRQRGVGKQLIKHLTQFCRANAVKQLYLFTPESRSYYETLGWTLVRRQAYKGQMVDIMVRAISAEAP